MLASSSVAALLVAGGAPSAGAAPCKIIINGGTTATVNNSSATGNCILIENGANVTGNVANTSTGVLTTSGATPPSATGIAINSSTINGAVVNAGTIQATRFGIEDTNNSAITGGIGNSGSIAATVPVLSTATAIGIGVNNVSSFSGGISNSGSIDATGFFSGSGIAVSNVGTFSGGITNSGAISGSGVFSQGGGIVVSGVNSFSGGIDNASTGTITATISGLGIAIGILAEGVSTFSNGITNAGTIQAAATGIRMVNDSTVTGGVTNSGSISAVTGLSLLSINSFSGGIGNSGTISGRGQGISANAISTFSGGISNSGTISGQVIGIAVSNVSSFSNGISNSGTISDKELGVDAQSIAAFSGGITNSGSISARTETGVRLFSINSFSGGISNSGTISAGLGGIVASVISTLSGGITNSGTINATGTFGVGLGTAGISNFSGGIDNSGTIVATGTRGVGISLFADGAFSGGITNSGTIKAGHLGVDVEASSSFSNGISNSGTISLSAGAGGVFVFQVTIFADGITNSGTISGGLVGVEASAISTFSGGISNSGAIIASGTGTNGTGAFGIGANSINFWRGSIVNSGTIKAAGAFADGLLAVNVTTFFGSISNSGTISAGVGGIVVEDINIFFGGITNSGTVSAELGGIEVSSISTFSGNISNSGTIAAKTGIGVFSGVSFAAGSAIVNSGTIAGSAASIDVSQATGMVVIDQNAGILNGNVLLSANADVLNIAGGAINGNIVGKGTADTINFNLGSGTFTYGPGFRFSVINQVNVNSGNVILDGENNATATTVYGGDLQIGDAANPGAQLTSTVAVDGGTLSGHGTVEGAVTVNAGGMLAPGGSIGALTIANGPLTFNAGSFYGIQLNDTAASNTLVNGAPGTVIINGGSVVAMPLFTLGAHGGTTFNILTATGGRTGTFAAVTSNDSSFTGAFSLSYDTKDVFLNVGQGFQILPLTPGLTVNQRDVATGINNAIVTGVTIPANFQTLNGLTGPAYLNALNQIDGEVATGAQVGAFQLDDQFLNLMLNPFVSGRGYPPGAPGAGLPLGFAPDRQADLPPDVALAYAAILGKAPPKQTFDRRWSVWGAGYGGGNSTNGDPAVIGSNNVTASTYGYAAGMDYRVSPNTIVGFALSGGGTNWNLANALGTGRSDTLLAGAYGVTWYGPAYLAGSLAFGNYWFTTNRTALGDQLRANFIGQSYSARFEGGYRYAVLPTLGVTPYAAVELQDFHTPTYSETDLTAGGFGLAYNALNAADVRTELGGRFDAPTLAYGKPLVLYGRLAWAHDFVSTPSLNATFQLLPGSGFTVFGAPIPHDSALATAGAQLFLTHNWSLIGTFNGQFASGSQTYAGSGTLRYRW